MAKRTPAAKASKTKTAASKTKSPKAKASKAKASKPAARKPAAKSTKAEADAGVAEVTIDRRREGERREGAAPAAGQEIAPRKKVNRRRQIDPTTCERDYSDQEVEFMNALDDYKRSSGRMFPTCSEVLEVVRSLGYVQLAPAELAARQAEEPAADDPTTDSDHEDGVDEFDEESLDTLDPALA